MLNSIFKRFNFIFGLFKLSYLRFHLVDQSPWPLATALASLSLATSLVMVFHEYNHSYLSLFVSFIFLGLYMGFWFSDVITEGTFEGQHTKKVRDGFKIGMILFIVSEIMFFFAFL